MSVATVNKFALLNDDGDDSVASLPPKAAAPAVVVEAQTPKSTTNRGRAAASNAQSRSGRYYKRGGAPTAEKDADGFTSPNPNDTGARFDRTEGRPDRGRGRGRGRGGRGGGDRPPRGRVHDKESQTGKVDTEKTINQGWGAETSELNAEISGEADAQAAAVEAAADGWGAPAADASAWDAPASEAAPAAAGEATPEAGKEGKEGGRRRRDEEEEEEDNTLTYEEYLAKQKADASSAVPKLEGTRTVGETEWKDAVQLLREESEDVYFAGKAKAAPKAKPKKEEKVYIQIDAPPPQRGGGDRGRGARGGRGGDRGGRGRGGDRGGRGRGGDRAPRGGDSWGNSNSNGGGRRGTTANVDVDDQSAFPSLA